MPLWDGVTDPRFNFLAKDFLCFNLHYLVDGIPLVLAEGGLERLGAQEVVGLIASHAQVPNELLNFIK